MKKDELLKMTSEEFQEFTASLSTEELEEVEKTLTAEEPEKESLFDRFIGWYEGRNWFVRFLLTAASIAFLYFIFIMIAWTKPYHEIKSSGPSMEPTIYEGDTITYQFLNAPFQKDKLTLDELKRGDIVGINRFARIRQHGKRLVGLPGDTIRFTEDGRVFVNDEELIYNERIAPENLPTQMVYVLGDDEYFVMGDNVNHSYDSKNYGPVKGRKIISRLEKIVRTTAGEVVYDINQ